MPGTGSSGVWQVKKRKKGLHAALLATALLCCAALAVLAAQGLFTRYTLRFTSGGAVTELSLRPGEYPATEALEAAGEGQRFICWLDASGAEAEPSALPAEGDAEYTALLGPALAEEPGPWLEAGEYGLALPDAPLTGAEAARGVNSLFEGGCPGAAALAQSETVTADALAAALEGCFAPSRLEAVSGREPLSRLEAAALLGGLYMEERGVPAPSASGRAAAPDLDPGREGAGLLALCLYPEGLRSYGEGPVMLGGQLYFVDGTGLFLMDTEHGGLYYGPDGRYTSGNAELDGLVTEILSGICAEHPEREEALEAAYEYVRDSFTYLRRNYYESGETGWETSEALTMLSTGRGNCYNYAAAFWALARGLGYDAEAVSGTISRRGQPHGWVMIDGLYYDPETEMAYRRDGVYDRHMFAMDEVRASQWSYSF